MSESKRIPITVFTGAGASRAEPICLPTMKEFFQQIMDNKHRPTHPRVSNVDYYKFILDTLYPDHDNYDLERIMGAIYNMNTFTEGDCWHIFINPRIFSQIASALNNTYRISGHSSSNNPGVDAIRDTVRASLDGQFTYYRNEAARLETEIEDLIREKYQHIANEHIVRVYEPFFDLLRLSCAQQVGKAPILPFFTTNYDMSVDWFFKPRARPDRLPRDKWMDADIKIEADYIPAIRLVDGFEDGEWSEEAYQVINEDDTGSLYVAYHKLHGSLFWEEVEGIVKRSSTVARDAFLNQKLVIVYPSDKKILTENPFYYSHKMLDNYLMRTDKLFIIGFSFRDPALVQAFSYGLVNNPELKIYVVHPDFDSKDFPEMQSFLDMHNDRVDHIPMYFGTDELLSKLEEILIKR